MSAEVVTKKRGRPKKVVERAAETDSVSDGISSPVTLTKRSSKTRSLSTAGTTTTASNARKPTRRNQAVIAEVMETAEMGASTPSQPSATSRSTKSSILDKATAFSRTKDSPAPKMSRTVATLSPFNPPPSTASTIQDPQSTQIPNHQTSLAEDQAQAAQKSSFLSSFLDDEFREPVPIVTEDAKISDRSAFDAPEVSVTNIVSGEGISALSSFPTPPPPPKLRTTTPWAPRQSAVPIKPAKVFKAHVLAEFPLPDGVARVKRTSRSIEPTRYAAGSFASFKTNTPNTSISPPAPSPTQASPSTAFRQTPPLSSPHPQQPSPPQPQIQPHASPSRPHPTQPYRAPQPIQPRRPTQMSAAELRKNPEFKSRLRRWTGLIAGIPVLVVSSYLLYNRLDMVDKAEAGKRAEMPLAELRQRGVMPQRGRLLEEKGPVEGER